MEASEFNRLLRESRADKRALEPIYREYFPLLAARVRRRFRNLVPPDDVVQDVFLALLDPPNNVVLSPDAWLINLTDHKAVDFLRREKGLRGENVADPTSSVGGEIDELILRDGVAQSLAALSPDDREIVYLRFWQGYSLKEISDLKNIGYETVRKKASRACGKLKRLFKKYDL